MGCFKCIKAWLQRKNARTQNLKPESHKRTNSGKPEEIWELKSSTLRTSTTRTESIDMTPPKTYHKSTIVAGNKIISVINCPSYTNNEPGSPNKLEISDRLKTERNKDSFFESGNEENSMGFETLNKIAIITGSADYCVDSPMVQ
ncbi:unnamed protein product [Blepharisma stoltei]|uniref:Uncharacterized protein n=1 Tax=Blepharisma stoltei TaxID=1481888 RepID=A0AAU9J7S2_9CILI|nr:unnamed protein product [Blepharisma stoltei]